MKSVSGAMDAHLNGVVTSLCTCWKITRSDGEVLGFTDHDKPLTIGGVEYIASSGYYRSAISNSADSSVDNLDVSGFLDDSSLSETELRNGAYDYAHVEVFAVNWADLSQGIVRLRFGYFGEVMIISSGFFKVELRGLTQLFSQTIGETYSPECRADLGDHRCKVQLVPPTRRSGAPVTLGTRVVVPQAPGANVNLPVRNGGFENNEVTAAYDYWVGATFRIWNGPSEDGYDPIPEYFMAPITTATGYAYFAQSRNQVGLLPESTSFELLTKASDISMAPRVKIRMYWGESASVSAGGVYDVETAWYDLPLGDGVLEIPSTGFPAAPIDEDMSHFFFRVMWENMPIDSDVVENIKLFPYPKVLGEVPGRASINPTGLPMGNATNWTFFSSAQSSGPNIWMAPQGGDWMLELFPGPDATASAYQDITFSAAMDEFLPLIDGPDGMKVRLDCWNGAETVAVENYVRFRFYNAANSLIGDVAQEPVYAHGRGYWGPFDFVADVPPLTRRIRIELCTHNTSNNARSRAVWDNVSLRVYEDSYENQANYLSYGKVEFVCTQAGTTAGTIPTFDYTLGVVTVDGTAQWTAVEPVHMFTANITEVISNSQFKVAGLNKPDDWFEWGVIEVLQGLNVKKKMEVMKWDNTTKTITLALPLPYLPIVGEAIRIHTGCAKSRAVCKDKFNNIVNYRGEPDLPGTDQYFKVGGANTGGSAPTGGK